MKIQKQNNISFKQRYTIAAKENIIETAIYCNKISEFFRIAQEPRFGVKTDSLTHKIYATSGEDSEKFLKYYFNFSEEERDKNSTKLFSDFFKGAFELGENSLEKLKAPLIDLNKNYKVNLTADANGGKNLHMLNDYLIAIGFKKSAIPMFDRLSNVGKVNGLSDTFIAVKDMDEYVAKMAELDKIDDLTDRELLELKTPIMSDYLSNATKFDSNEAAGLLNRIRTILGLSEIS